MKHVHPSKNNTEFPLSAAHMKYKVPAINARREADFMAEVPFVLGKVAPLFLSSPWQIWACDHSQYP